MSKKDPPKACRRRAPEALELITGCDGAFWTDGSVLPDHTACAACISHTVITTPALGSYSVTGFGEEHNRLLLCSTGVGNEILVNGVIRLQTIQRVGLTFACQWQVCASKERFIPLPIGQFSPLKRVLPPSFVLRRCRLSLAP